MSRRVLVAGLGNVLRGDDAIGPYAIKQLQARYEFPPDVELADLGTPGLELALHLSSADYVLIIDALRGVAPGALVVYDDHAITSAAQAKTGVRLDAHSAALGEALVIARLRSEHPRELRLVGLGGAGFDFGTGMTPSIRAQVPALVAAAIEQLVQWGLPPPTLRPDAPATWSDDDSLV